MTKKELQDSDFEIEEYGLSYELVLTLNAQSEEHAKEIKADLIRGMMLQDHIQNMIDRCKIEMERIRENGNISKKPNSMSVDIWNDIQEQRHEHLSDFQSSLKFMLTHTGVPQTV